MSINEIKLHEFLGKAVGDLGAAMSATLMLVGDLSRSKLMRIAESVIP